MILYSNQKNMNKDTKKRYQEISKPILSGAVFVASVGLIGAGALAASSSLYNLKAENPANNNQLTAENWDTLVTEVENLKNQITKNTQEAPSGAVIAFDSESCPEWWTRFADADWRFIMGTEPGRAGRYPREPRQPKVGLKGGNNNIKLTIEQLPPHYFYVVAAGSKGTQIFHNPAGSIADADTSQSSPYSLRSSHDGREAAYWRTNTLWKGNNIDITNPYIKLLYCKKN